MNTLPLIVAFTADVPLMTALEQTAQSLGFSLRVIQQVAEIGAAEAVASETPGELLNGRTGQLFAKITAWQPALLIFDLNQPDIPWYDWIAVLKSSAATRRLAILGVAEDGNSQQQAQAKSVAANEVNGRSHFLLHLPQIIQKHARIPDYVALNSTCQQPLSALAREGLELFNKGEYFACHEALEQAWNAEKGPGRELYRGILQIGVAYYQIERGNYRGAIKMLMRVRQWLDPFPDVCRGIHIAELRTHAQIVYETLLALGPERVAQLDRALLKPVSYQI